MASLSIVIPTLGKPTLDRTLQSIVKQLEPQDEVILVSDGHNFYTRKLAEEYRATYRIYSTPSNRENPVGQDQRRFAISAKLAKGDYLMWLGDDDVLISNALDIVRASIDLSPGYLFMFQMLSFWGATIWHTPGLIEEGNVSDQIAVFPNIPEKLGTFGLRYQGDLDYVTSTLALQGGPDRLVWVPRLIVVCRPDQLCAVPV